MDEVHQDTDIPIRLSDQGAQYEAHNIHQNTITIDGCKCGIDKIFIITQGTKITHLHLLMPFEKPHMGPKEARIIQFNGIGTKRQPPWTIFNIVSYYDSYESE